MLAPDDLDDITGTLKSVYAEMRYADRLVTMGGSFRIYDIGEKASWVASLRSRVSLMAKDAETWLDDKPTVASLSLSTFARHSNAFSAAAKVLRGDSSKDAKVQALEQLRLSVQECMTDAQKSDFLFERWVHQMTAHLDALNESIRDAWSNLGSAEKKVVALAEQIVAIQDGLNALTGVVAPDQLSSQTASNLAKILANSASLVYSVVFAGLPVPYLSVAVTFFTLGKLFYTIFSTEKNIHKQIQQLVAYRLDLNEAQLALAQTKAALSFLYDLKNLLSGQRSSLAGIETFWREEVRNITTVRDKFALAPDITPDDPELRQLPVAQAVWDELKDLGQGLISNLGRGTDGKTTISITT